MLSGRMAGATLALALLTALPAAGDIVIGPMHVSTGNYIPFDPVPGSGPYPMDYQQIYNHEVFPGRTTITSVGFESVTGTSPDESFDLTVGLGTAATTLTTPSAQFADNKGPDFTTVFSGIIKTTGMGNIDPFDLVIPTTPFTYDPAKGDLLLDIVLHTTPTGGFGPTMTASDTPDISRIFTYSGTTQTQVSYGLTTRFGTVPEPGAVAFLIGAGLSGAVFALRRR